MHITFIYICFPRLILFCKSCPFSFVLRLQPCQWTLLVLVMQPLWHLEVLWDISGEVSPFQQNALVGAADCLRSSWGPGSRTRSSWWLGTSGRDSWKKPCLCSYQVTAFLRDWWEVQGQSTVLPRGLRAWQVRTGSLLGFLRAWNSREVLLFLFSLSICIALRICIWRENNDGTKLRLVNSYIKVGIFREPKEGQSSNNGENLGFS